MATLILFHHAFGLTDGVRALADRIGAGRHAVHTPDLFEGQVFSSIEDGLGYVEGVGLPVLLQRGAAAADSVGADAVYAGISLGVLPAQQLAQTRPGARGALLLEACVPPTEFGTGWPVVLPLQVHGMDGDEFFAGEGDLEAARGIVNGPAQAAELFRYPGDAHLFVDEGLPGFDAAATDLLVERATALLDRVS